MFMSICSVLHSQFFVSVADVSSILCEWVTTLSPFLILICIAKKTKRNSWRSWPRAPSALGSGFFLRWCCMHWYLDFTFAPFIFDKAFLAFASSCGVGATPEHRKTVAANKEPKKHVTASTEHVLRAIRLVRSLWNGLETLSWSCDVITFSFLKNIGYVHGNVLWP